MPAAQPDPGQEGTAFHEAGHAVIAYRLGYELGGTSIDSDVEGKLGHSASHILPKRLKATTDWRRENVTDDEWKAAWDEIVVYLAGASAEARYNRQVYAPDPDNEQSTDEKEVLARLRRMYCDYETENVRFHVAVAQARELIDRYWMEIEALAGALVQQQTMTVDETVAAITSGLANGS